MPKLEILNIAYTNIKRLPDTLINLKNLKVVYISESRFDDLCKNFENTDFWRKFRVGSGRYVIDVDEDVT
jgi:hypothetical protein